MVQYEDWRGRRVIDPDDRLLGTLEEVYLDEEGGATRWAVVHTGVGAQPRSFVPLRGAEQRGEEVRLRHPRGLVLAAAEIEPSGELTRREERRLEELYGLPGNELVVSEEQVRIATRVRTAGKVRLRKVIVSEDVTVTVTVRREELRLEPVELEGGPEGGEFGRLHEDGEPLFEVTLHEEVPDVRLRVVPRERIRVRKVLVTEPRTITETVRAERVQLTEERHRA